MPTLVAGLRELLLDERAACTLLRDGLDRSYGEEWLRVWEEPETIQQTLEMDAEIAAGGLPLITRDKIHLMRVLANQDIIWEDLRVFDVAVNTCNHEVVSWTMLEGARPEELAYFMSQVRRLDWMDEPSSEVRRYVAGLLGTDGWVVPPPECGVFEPDLDAYNLQNLTPSRLADLKARIKLREGNVVRDDDENAVDVAVARIQKTRLYLKVQDEKERRSRERLKLED